MGTRVVFSKHIRHNWGPCAVFVSHNFPTKTPLIVLLAISVFPLLIWKLSTIFTSIRYFIALRWWLFSTKVLKVIFEKEDRNLKLRLKKMYENISSNQVFLNLAYRFLYVWYSLNVFLEILIQSVNFSCAYFPYYFYGLLFQIIELCYNRTLCCWINVLCTVYYGSLTVPFIQKNIPQGYCKLFLSFDSSTYL